MNANTYSVRLMKAEGVRAYLTGKRIRQLNRFNGRKMWGSMTSTELHRLQVAKLNERVATHNAMAALPDDFVCAINNKSFLDMMQRKWLAACMADYQGHPSHDREVEIMRSHE